MLHADHCYNDHAMRGVVADDAPRGAGVELRLHGLDPDQAERAAREHGYTVLDSASDKPHGLREAYLVDDDGYICLTPSLPIGALQGSVELFKAELESLLEQARQRYSEPPRLFGDGEAQPLKR